MNKAISILLKSLRRDRNLKSIGGIILILLGLGVAGNLVMELPKVAIITLTLLAFLFLQLGVTVLWHGTRSYQKVKNDLIHLLEDNIDNIVWVYYSKVESKPYGISVIKMTTLYIGLLDGEKLGLSIPEPDIEELLDILKFNLPSASFGYSRSKEQLYEISPQLLQGDIV